MDSVPFAVLLRTEPEFYHPYGGILQGVSTAAIHYGIDYGGKGGFSDDTLINVNSLVSHVAIVPISRDTVDRYKQVVNAFRVLHDNNRLPFYLTGSFRANAYFEPSGSSNLPDGTEVTLPDSFGYYNESPAVLYTARNEKVTDPERLKPPGLQRIRINCVTFFNLATQLAGIDFSQINTEWFSFRRGAQVASSLRDVFDKHAIDAKADEVCWNAEIGLPSLRRIIAGKTLNGANISFEHMINQVSVAHGGLEGLQEKIAKMPPFAAPTMPWPAYLRRELDNLGHYIP